MILRTAEVRWFFPKPLPDPESGFPYTDWNRVEQRTDHYLPMAPSETVGVKLRGRKFEIKAQHGIGEVVSLSDNATGVLELWQKWSLDDSVVQDLAAAMRQNADLIEIEKRR